MQIQKIKPGYKLARLLYKKFIEIPQDWEEKNGELLFSLSGGVSPSEINFSKNGTCLFIQVDDMNSSENSKEIIVSKLKFDEVDNNTIRLKQSERIVFPKRGAAILGNKVRILKKKSTVDPNLMVLECKDMLSSEFFYHELFFLKLSNLMESAGVPQLNNKDLYPRNFLRPPLPEQQKITSILSNVDNLIEQYDSVIESTKKLKTGLMQQLLTKGIGHKKFKKVKLLNKKFISVPEEWKVGEIQNHAKITTGSKNTQDKIEDGKYPFFVRSQTIKRINSYSYDGEAILTAGDGVGTGKVFHYINGKFDFHQRVYKISDFDNKLDGYFFYLYFSNYFLYRVLSMSAKASVDSVRLDMISKMLTPLPTVQEQQKIASILSNVDSKISDLKSKKSGLEILKKGLMQKLLTGQIRV